MSGASPNLYSFPDVDSLAKQLRRYVLINQNTALGRHDVFRIAVSGGSLPNTLAKALLAPGDGSAEDTAQFSKWEIFFADERAVPLDHPDSNYRLIKEELLEKIPANLGVPIVHPIDAEHVHDDDPTELADLYTEDLKRTFAAKDSVKVPIFDLILLGVGPDGHTCSLFPGHPQLREKDAWVVGVVDSPKPPPKRITLTLPVVTHAVSIAFVATGGGKKDILKRIFDTDEGHSLPSGLVNAQGAGKTAYPRCQPPPPPQTQRAVALEASVFPHRQRSRTVGSSIPVSSADNVSTKKSLLPQPRTVSRGPLADLKKAQGGNAEPTKELQEQIPNALPEPPRADAQYVKEAPSLPSRPRIERVVTRSKSPSKPQQNDSKSTATAPTKNAAMPPPARPARSASLRQPSAPKLVGSADGKGHARHRSQVLDTTHTRGTPPLLPTPSRQPEKSGVAKQPRPQFTTYQQHFSPKKEKEAPRTIEKRAGKPTENNLPPPRPEVAALQTELLQLSLLYSASLKQNKEWKAAAEKQLKGKYRSVAATYRALSDEERHIQERLNLMALYDWSVDSATVAENDSGNNFQAQIQSFSRVTQEIADMTADASGRYTLAIEAFEEWLAEVESVRASRHGLSTSVTGLEGAPRYIDTLGRPWRDEVDDLSIKAELCLRELARITIFAINEDEFCRNHSNSALVQIAQQQRNILRSMVDELKTMRTIELETINFEKAWVAQAADQATADYRLRKNSSTHSWGAWRT